MEIYKRDNKIIFEFPVESNRYNPYGSDEENEKGVFGTYPYFTGLIVRHRKDGSDWDEIGFAGTIDMDYAGKPDQVSDFIVSWNGEEDEFRKKCEELGIGIHEYEF